MALDFASYGATGKTVADHGLSAVLQKDCALLRGLKGQVCVAEGSAEATTKPPREAETRASRRLALLEEESNRATAHLSTGSEARVTLQSTFATDPSIAPNPVPDRRRRAAKPTGPGTIASTRPSISVTTRVLRARRGSGGR
ncbi:MAG: hypothetical protein IH924_09910 [Proteobacteria bacterium]|nr:hypothetical protein [Pseudomonadota bacterium]